MDIFTFLSLIAGIFSFVFGVFIIAKNPKDSKNRSFFYLCLISAAISFVEFEFRTAESYETAYFWYKAFTIWPFSLTFSLHFVKHFANFKNTATSRILFTIAHLSGIAFFVIDAYTNLLSAEPTRAFWGWKVNFQDNYITTIALIWIMAMFGLILFFAYWPIKYGKNNIQKSQAKFIFTGFLIIVIVTLITDTIFPALNINFPELSNSSDIIGYLCIAYAMNKYKLFDISPYSASNQIIETLPGPLALTDNNGIILFANNQTEALFMKGMDKIVGSPINLLLKNENVKDETDKVINNLKFNETYEHGNRIKLNLLVNRICIRDQYKNIQGFVYLINDIGELNELVKTKNEAELADKQKSKFIFSIYQEIKNPLNEILALSNQLINKNFTEHEKEVNIKLINEKTNFLNSYINKLIEIIKIETRQIPINNTLISINNVFKKIKSKFNYDKFELVLINVFEKDKNVFMFDLDLLIKTLTLLIEILIQHSEKGIVKLGWYKAAENTLQIFITSSSFSLPEKKQSRPFRNFEMYDQTKLRYFGLPGLNLAIAKGYSDYLNGSLKLEFVENSATFFLRLPALSGNNEE